MGAGSKARENFLSLALYKISGNTVFMKKERKEENCITGLTLLIWVYLPM